MELVPKLPSINGIPSFIPYTIATLTVGSSLVYVYIKWSKAKTIRRFRERNLEFVDMPSLFSQSTENRHFELEEYERVKKYGKIFASKIFFQDTIFIAEPEMIGQILSKEFTSFTNRREFKIKDPMLSAMLSITMDEQWKRLRSIVTPTFSMGKLKRMKPRIDDSIATLMKNIEEALQASPNIEVKELYGAYTMDTIMQVAFGTKVNSLHDKNNPIVAQAKTLFSNDISIGKVIAMMIFVILPGLTALLGKLGLQDDAIGFFKDFSLKVINEKREKLKKGESLGKASNFLELLLEAEAENAKLTKNESETGIDGESGAGKLVKFMTTDEMMAQCILFFLAAYDTTTSTISLASYFLAINPSIQERLHDEITTVLEKLRQESPVQLYDPMKLVTFEALPSFEYLNAVVNETLRYYPPASIERTASRDIELTTDDGQVKVALKKGDIVHIPTFSCHRDPEQFPEPEVFNPDRFIGEPTFHKYSYLPFGSGPRNCVAKSLALLEAKLAILNVVYRYKLSPCEATKIPVEFYNNGQILTPKNVTLKLERRS